jgi:hypothetical protein
MNKILKIIFVTQIAALVLAFGSLASAQVPKAPADSAGEHFYIISSVDIQKHQVVLMEPTQLTIVATADNKSVFLGEQRQKLALTDLRAGQTVWALLRKDKSGKRLIVRIREGAMSIAELHRLYLDYPEMRSNNR